ncbi:MarR family winged helix-turn-helix transcriptional regulator [Nocardioides donggukensis]|uniref:MarR family transcriptional regulator n=1 Tax=Nocardioides donggukensis TaxID=2774019 RepID=A0A927Q1E3_9ACTN|nr:MarR family transcriptional regulator [Nocardioides donggukensis]MBD8869987.1 MarR family transcriptional regulator [Nocardioides donggukensis]
MQNPNDQIEQQLFTLLRRTQAIHVQTSSGEVELERSAYGILCLIADEGPHRLGAIAAAFRLDPSTITRQVQAVVRLGLAAKTVDASDRRASLLSLTDEGRVAIGEARAHRRRMLDAILADWTLDERTAFMTALTRFNRTIDDWDAHDAVPD